MKCSFHFLASFFICFQFNEPWCAVLWRSFLLSCWHDMRSVPFRKVQDLTVSSFSEMFSSYQTNAASPVLWIILHFFFPLSHVAKTRGLIISSLNNTDDEEMVFIMMMSVVSHLPSRVGAGQLPSRTQLHGAFPVHAGQLHGHRWSRGPLRIPDIRDHWRPCIQGHPLRPWPWCHLHWRWRELLWRGEWQCISCPAAAQPHDCRCHCSREQRHAALRRRTIRSQLIDIHSHSDQCLHGRYAILPTSKILRRWAEISYLSHLFWN